MNVSLTPELVQFVNQKVESGKYQTASEVIRDGLRLPSLPIEEHSLLPAGSSALRHRYQSRVRP